MSFVQAGEEDREERRGNSTYAGTACISARAANVDRRANSAVMASSWASCLSLHASIVARCARCSASACSRAASRAYASSAYRRDKEEEVSRGRKREMFSSTRTSSARSRLPSWSTATSRARLRMFFLKKHFHPFHDTYSSYSARKVVMSPARSAHCCARAG